MSPPDFTHLREGRQGCPSDFTLDRLHAGELSREEALEPERHVASCADCTARLAQRRAGFDAVDGVDPRAMLARIRTGLDRPAPLPQRLLGWARQRMAPLALVTTAAVAVVVMSQQSESPATRMKGTPALHVFRQAGDHAEEVVSGGVFAPGDRLRFSVDLPAEGQVAVLGIESSGVLYTAWPLEPGQRTRLKAGTAIELPGAVALDAQPGRETLYLVHCPATEATPSCESRGANLEPTCPPGCVATPFVMEKKEALP